MTKILVVDDEQDLELLIKQKFRHQITNKEFEFFFANNGVEALKLLREHKDFVMVLTDINMPEMDGLTLIDKINALYTDIICVIISAYGDMSNIRAAMNLGAFDFVTKPINFSDLNITIDQALKQIRLLRSSELNKLKLNAILQELNVASNIQQSILPKQFITKPEIELYASMKPAREIGGDFYDFFYLSPDLLAFVIADVSGKGVPAALFMTVSRTLLRAHAQIQQSPAVSLQQVNDLLADENDSMMFVTTFYGQINLKTGHVVYANAGHTHPILIKNSDVIMELPSTHGIPLGILEGFIFKEEEFDLKSGDTLFLYTDGLTDAMNVKGEEYSLSAVLAILKKNRDKPLQQMIETIKTSVNEFSKDQNQFDDITMLALRYAPVS